MEFIGCREQCDPGVLAEYPSIEMVPHCNNIG